ncbi:MAG: hypothetical protein KKF26_01850 [Chloroflexi bacterium]|nr:hypothetical protein [Chloroflexota bacterium]
MLDRDSIEEFLESELGYAEMGIPSDISKGDLVDAFFNYIETEYYEWLRENYMAFFNDGDPDWDWIREQIGSYEE